MLSTTRRRINQYESESNSSHILCLRIYTYTGILFSISGYLSQHTPAGLLLTCHDVKAGILELHSLLELHTLEVLRGDILWAVHDVSPKLPKLGSG